MGNEKKIGFIGTGSMGSALARAARSVVPGDRILLANRSASKRDALAKELGAVTMDNAQVAAESSYLFLGVKPQSMEEVLLALRGVFRLRTEPFILVTMAAGVSIARVKELSGGNYPVIRIMPNLPCSIGEGVVLYTVSREVGEGELEVFLALLSGAGRFVQLEEEQFSAGAAVSGCGPAFVQLFLESLADGGVACGLPRSAALELAAQTVLGSCRLLTKTQQHPAQLKDAVCSPGGTTIQGVRALERLGFRSAVMEAVIAACERDRHLAAAPPQHAPDAPERLLAGLAHGQEA